MVAFNRFNRFRKGKGKPKQKAKKVVRAPRMTFAQKVNQIIARNTENKITQSFSYSATVNSIYNIYNAAGNTNTYNAFVWHPGSTIFAITQGPNVQERVGNQIKIKRWIIKGYVEPNKDYALAPAPLPTITGICNNSQLGYVDIYFGKFMSNTQPIGATLPDFFQSGSTAITPSYTSAEKLYRVNKDVYKIYYHKRVRLGSNTVVASSSTPATDPTFSQANGFSTTRSFGFDVCKYICKNKVLTYDESFNQPQSADIQNLTLFAIFHPAAGDMGPPVVATASSGSTINNCYYSMNCLSYAEYEDA